MKNFLLLFLFLTFIASYGQPNKKANRGNCDYVFTNNFHIECDDPPYDSNGNVRYKGYITVHNRSSLNGVLTNHPNSTPSQHIGINIPGATLTTSTSGTIGSPCLIFPLVSTVNGPAYAPNQTVTRCFNLTVPFGTTSVEFLSQIKTRVGTNEEATCNANRIVQLPPCVCDLCENDWQINHSNLTFARLGTLPDGASFFLMGINFDIQNAANIREITAEIVSVKHDISDPQCHTCTKNQSRMGLFRKGTGSGQINPNTGWQNGGIGTLSDRFTTDGFGNEFRWQTNSPFGVDLSISKRMMFNLTLPELSTLKCCSSKFEVCVRYTFTDINCNTCSKIVCFNYDSSSRSPVSPIQLEDNLPIKDLKTPKSLKF